MSHATPISIQSPKFAGNQSSIITPSEEMYNKFALTQKVEEFVNQMESDPLITKDNSSPLPFSKKDANQSILERRSSSKQLVTLQPSNS